MRQKIWGSGSSCCGEPCFFMEKEWWCQILEVKWPVSVKVLMQITNFLVFCQPTRGGGNTLQIQHKQGKQQNHNIHCFWTILYDHFDFQFVAWHFFPHLLSTMSQMQLSKEILAFKKCNWPRQPIYGIEQWTQALLHRIWRFSFAQQNLLAWEQVIALIL